MKALVTTLWLATVLAAVVPATSGSAGTDVGARPAITGHHEETPRK